MTLEILKLVFEYPKKQTHELADFIRGTIPVLRREGVYRNILHAPI
jgi:hypothetical protein